MILITGASGFLGSVLTQQLLSKGLPVRALKRTNSTIPDFLKDQPGLDWVLGDMNEYFSLEEALEGVTQVYHTAALVSFLPGDEKKMIKANVEGTANLVNLCLDRPGIRLVHVSSIAALGQGKPDMPVSELDILEAGSKPSAYALSKYLSEMEVWRGIAEGLDAVIVNPSIIIGKETGWKGSGTLFGMVKKGLKYYPGGSGGFVEVNDVASAMIQLMESKLSGERYIINAENWLYRDLFQEIAKNFGVRGPQKAIKNWQLQTLAVLSEIAGKLLGKKSGLSRATARSATRTSQYANQKIQNTLKIKFKPIRQSIAEICDSLK